jgi:DNA-binding response OmpR family regulator
MDKPKTLIVDDDPDLSRGLNLRLRQPLRHRLRHRRLLSHRHGAERASGTDHSRHRPAGGDGFILLDRLQQSAQLSSIPVIILTARDPQYNRERTLKAGGVRLPAKACPITTNCWM